MNKYTKITASIGPKSENREILKNMILNGMNVCRLNFSHDTGDVQGNKIDTIRSVARELGKTVAILIDLQGPKHRIGVFKTDERYPIEIGQEFILDNLDIPGDSTRVQLPDLDVLHSLKVGDRVLLDDGKIELKVEEILKDSIKTKVIRGFEIWSRRGFNIPDTKVNTSVLTKKDREDLTYALTKNPDYIAISFVQTPEDVLEVRNFIKERTNNPVKIIAKIERPSAVDKISEIIDVSDGIMIARGDLAVEVSFEKVPSISRRIVKECRLKNKPVIMATQMLGSMVKSEFPLRSEISDIANAAYLPVDSTMTSEETTVSENPPLVIETMSKILSYADMDKMNSFYSLCIDCDTVNGWSKSVVSIATLNNADAIVVFANSTNRVFEISCRRSNTPIVAICDSEIVANQLCLSRAVFPIFDRESFDKKDVLEPLKNLNLNYSKIVIVDGEEVSLKTF